MNKQEFQTSKEASWRNHLARHAASGKSIAAFCRDDGLPAAATLVLPPLVFRMLRSEFGWYLVLAFASSPAIHVEHLGKILNDRYWPIADLPGASCNEEKICN